MWWHKIAVDLGTAYSLVYTAEKGVVLSEPSAVALHRTTREPIAFGERARTMLGRAPEFIDVVRPLSDGVIADFDAARALLKHFIKIASQGHRFSRKAVIVSVPYGATSVEMEALVREAEAAGAARVDVVREPFAAALGAGLPIHEPRGNLVIDIGGGTTEVTSLALNDVVHCESIRMAGTSMDQALQAFFRNRYNFFIGENTAEQIKIHHGAVTADGDGLFEVKGLNQRTGKPQRFMVHSAEVYEALEPAARHITDAVRRCVERLSPELAADVFTDGAAMVGGGALLPGWQKRLWEAMNLKVRISEEPLMSVMRGLIEIVHNRERHEMLIVNSRVRRSLE
ncbi:MAG TPA: rod shape-determining protein [Terriglobales bacterium]|nr:rod shape-determining protein [Terriglobales bacterium]